MRFRLGISLIQDKNLSPALRFAEFDFIKHSLHALLALPDDESPRISLFIPAEFNCDRLITKKDKRLKIIRVPCDQYGFSTELQTLIDKEKCDVFFPFCTLPSFKLKGPLFTWLPYIEPEHQAIYYGQHQKHFLETVQPFLIEHSDHVICFSEQAAKTLPDSIEKTVLSITPYLASQEESSSESTLKKYGITKDYIYLSSPIVPHKNIETVFAAWTILKSQDQSPLLVFNTQNTHRDFDYQKDLLKYIESHQLNDSILLLKHVSDEEEKDLIQEAKAVLFPALCDTWNTQLTQARLLGKKILASDILLHREECGEEASYFSEHRDEAGLATRITRYLFSIEDQKREKKIHLTTTPLDLIHFAKKLILILAAELPKEKNPERQLILHLSSELYYSKATTNRNEISTIKNKIGHQLSHIEQWNQQLEHYKDIMNTLNQTHQATHERMLRATAVEEIILAEPPKGNADHHEILLRNKQSIINEQNQIIHSTEEQIHYLKNTFTDVLAKYEKITKEQQEVIKKNNELIEEFQENYESLLFKHRKIIEKNSLKKLIKFFWRMPKKLYRTLRAFLRPKLGQLYLHPPRMLKIPKHYLKPIKTPNPLPRISIVTPAFQQGNFIERTMNSVLSQNYQHLEYIIQDGGSTDGTRDILKKYENKLTRWESQKDNGQSHAINLGFRNTTGDIMAYLNSDDLLLPGTLHYVGQYFAEHPDVDVIYGHRVLIDEFDHDIGRWVLPPHDDKILPWVDFIPQETLFWRRRIWDKTGGQIDESFRFAMDWDLILRFREAGAKFVRLPRFLGAFRVHSNQKTSAAMSKIGIKEMQRLRRQCHGRPVSSFEINKAIKFYLKYHWAYHQLWCLKLLKY